MIDLTGRTALVTGGSRGIGAATCRVLAQAGADVAVHYATNREAAETVMARVKKLGRRAVVLQADLNDPQAAEELPARAHARLKGLDLLVNNAGIWIHQTLDEMSHEKWRETMRLNLDAVYCVTHGSLKLLRASEHAAIVNVTSTAGQRGEPEYAHYAASKGALISWTKSLAVELAPRIRVNAVAPGWIETNMVAGELENPDRRAAIEHGIPLGRVGRPDDIANAIAFLVSDLARHITGEVLNVNGGAVLCG